MQSFLPLWVAQTYRKVSLDGAGLVLLAELPAIVQRTALTGTSVLLDCLVICPGLHKQQTAPRLNDEYPICAAMTTGYVFRIENPATVFYMQKIGRSGHLTTVFVSSVTSGHSILSRFFRFLFDFDADGAPSDMIYLTAVTLTLYVLFLLAFLKDWWGLVVMIVLVLARLINVLIIRHRARMGWKGQPEPGQKSDLIVLLSQDKWVRLRGATDDVKAITSGIWLRDLTFGENVATTLCTLSVYLAAGLLINSSKEGKLLFLGLCFGSAILLELANQQTWTLKMYGRRIKPGGPPVPYRRRLLLAKELIRETKRADWAIRLGMVQPKDVTKLTKEENLELVDLAQSDGGEQVVL